MIQIPECNLLLVEVPVTAKNIEIMDLDAVAPPELTWDCANQFDSVELPGSYSIVGTTDEITNIQCAEICAWFEIAGRRGWKDYEVNYVSYPYSTPYQSFQSLLRANKVPTDKRFVILKKQ